MKNVLTITGIRPDFIRMSKLFKALDDSPKLNHTMIHSGQHFDKLLSDVFFQELSIREPDYNLHIGEINKPHWKQTSDLNVQLFELIEKEKLKPDIILFLGDSNSVVCSVPLKKEGYKIGHIEAGMRSGDKRMLEEINRTVCDHCSDMLFVYHEDYRQNALKENIPDSSIFVVGNTIKEVCEEWIPKLNKDVPQHILLDIHRPENFKSKDRIECIIKYSNIVSDRFNLPVKMLKFNRTFQYIDQYGLDLGVIKEIPLQSYRSFLELQLNSLFIISDSGTGQEEPAIMNIPVIVPRDFTERPQSIKNNCSFMINVNHMNETWSNSVNWLLKIFDNEIVIGSSWLSMSAVPTSQKIVWILEENL